MSKKKAVWQNGCGNKVLEGDGFFISYNPCPWSGLGSFASDTGGAETALVKLNDGNKREATGYRYYILNGDFRKEFEEVVYQGFEKCLEVYKKYKNKCNSSWTTKEIGEDESNDY